MTDKSKSGRPPLTPGEKPSRVSVSVPNAEYDRAYERARRDGVSVSQVLRRGLRRELSDDADD